MMPGLADPDDRFDRPASPFALEQLLHQRRADVIERVVIGRLAAMLERPGRIDPAEREGALLTSAILFGALLDKRRWDAWLIASRGIFVGVEFRPQQATTIDVTVGTDIIPMRTIPRLHHHGRAWVELPANGEHRAGRWIADPLTHCLLRHWQDIRVDMSYPIPTAADAVAALLGWRSLDPARADQLLDGLHRAAVLKWRMRMPAFLVEEIGTGGRCVSLTDQRFRAMTRGRVAIVPQTRKAARAEPGVRTDSDPVMAILTAALPQGRHSGRRSFVQAAQTLGSEAFRNDLAPVERQLLFWAADRLDPARDRRQRQRGLAPSTIRDRARRLLHHLRGTFGQDDPQMLDAAGFAERLNDHLADDDLRQSDRSHLSCYTDWQQRRIGSLSVAWHGGERRESGVRNTILSGGEYAALLDRFDPRTANGAMARLLVMLGFRAGLRWDEASNLRVRDMLVTDRHVELSIRQNVDNRLKTPAGRRVIPLHGLLDEAERHALLDWWHDRRIAAMARTDRSDVDAARLFPRWGLPLHQGLKRDIVHALAEVTGGNVRDFHQLRHSCGSYLLATLALPGDMGDRDLVPPIDPTLVSQARRGMVAPLLLGEGGGTRGAVHAVGALLGHSGDHATLRSYMHLHDWLAGIHVSRPAVQPALPVTLVATLLEMRPSAVERANRRAGTADMALDQRRRRGRPRADDPRSGAVILGPLLDTPPAPGVVMRKAKRRSNTQHPPEWPVLAALMSAADADDREMLLRHPQLSSPTGRRTGEALLVLLDERTRGRGGISRPRFVEDRGDGARRRAHRLGDAEAERLDRLYKGVLALDPRSRRLLCTTFVDGYDRPRGVLRVAGDRLAGVTEALRLAGCREQETIIVRSQRSATIKIGDDGRTDRGFLWAMLFATAVQRAGTGTRTSVFTDA